MASYVKPNLKMAPDSKCKVFRGSGFIAELQSLFFPQFNTNIPDVLTGCNWLEARSSLLGRQQEFFNPDKEQDPKQQSLYGLSAGEIHCGLFGLPILPVSKKNEYVNLYTSFGVDGVKDDKRTGLVIHPHYVLMSYLSGDKIQRFKARNTILKMEKLGLFPPFGLVEAFSSKDPKRALGMASVLNASFEAISSYHIFKDAQGQPDPIFMAAESDPALAKAMRLFYPENASVKGESLE